MKDEQLNGDNRNSQTSLEQADKTSADEAIQLKDLATEVRDQDDVERDIGRQVRILVGPHDMSTDRAYSGNSITGRTGRRAG